MSHPTDTEKDQWPRVYNLAPPLSEKSNRVSLLITALVIDENGNPSGDPVVFAFRPGLGDTFKVRHMKPEAQVDNFSPMRFDGEITPLSAYLTDTEGARTVTITKTE